MTFVRSPMLTNAPPGIGITSGSSPDRSVTGGTSGMTRGEMPATASAIARVCSGVDPQHDPATLTRPARAHSPSAVAVTGGVSS